MAGLLDEVIEAHGGLRRWVKAKEIRAHARSGGLLPLMKRMKLADYGLSVATDRQSATFEPYPGPGRTGIFRGDSVRVVATGGEVVGNRDGAREAFFGAAGLTRKLRWDKLDSLYFAGYAMWNYMNLPFMLADERLESSEGDPMEVEGEGWRRLDVSFPEGFHTHSREQSFYFDERGLLRRHDYSPDVFSKRANGIHLSDAHCEFDGLVFPTRRRVLPRGPGGRPLPGPTMVWIELDSISVS